MGWKPPTESEFDRDWLHPDHVLTPTGHPIEDQAEQRALLEQLRAGLLIGVARSAAFGGKTLKLERVPTSVWESLGWTDEEHFWNTGQVVARVGGVTGYGDGETRRYFDVRIGPRIYEEPQPDERPPIVAQAENDSAHKYETWVRAPVALKSLEAHIGEGFARVEIYRRLCGGELLAMARTANWYGQAAVRVEDYSVLGAFLWMANKPPLSTDLIWKTGTHTFSRAERPGGTKYPVECFGIRFDPLGLAGILTDAGINTSADSDAVEHLSEPAKRRQDLPVLPDPIARAWAEWFKKQPGASKDAAESAARQMFPNHNFSRDRIRDLMGPSTLGRPQKSKG